MNNRSPFEESNEPALGTEVLSVDTGRETNPIRYARALGETPVKAVEAPVLEAPKFGGGKPEATPRPEGAQMTTPGDGISFLAPTAFQNMDGRGRKRKQGGGDGRDPKLPTLIGLALITGILIATGKKIGIALVGVSFGPWLGIGFILALGLFAAYLHLRD